MRTPQPSLLSLGEHALAGGRGVELPAVRGEGLGNAAEVPRAPR